MRRRPALAVATAAAALLLPLTAGCGALSKAIDCGQLAVDITADAEQLTEALANAGQDPQGAKDALDALEKDLDRLGDQTENADVRRAVDDLREQVEQTREDLESGRIPSGKPVSDAATEVANVCTPG